MTPLRSLSRTEATIELLRLCVEAGDVERRMLIKHCFGDDRGVATAATALEFLKDTVGSLNDIDRLGLLYRSRRLVVLGQREYGRLDLASYSKDPAIEALEEDCDATHYRMIGELKGRPDGLLNRSAETLKEALTALLARELL